MELFSYGRVLRRKGQNFTESQAGWLGALAGYRVKKRNGFGLWLKRPGRPVQNVVPVLATSCSMDSTLIAPHAYE